MTHELTCPGCHRTSPVPDPVAESLYTCDDCGARVAFGVYVPTLRVLPVEGDPEKRFVTVRFTHPSADGDLTVDRALGALLARDLLSVCAPDAYARLCEADSRVAEGAARVLASAAESGEDLHGPDSSGAHSTPPLPPQDAPGSADAP